MRSFLKPLFCALLVSALYLPRHTRAETAPTKPLPGTPEYARWVEPRASKLPIPAAPPVPPKRTSFDIPPTDPALDAAKRIADRVARFPNNRARSPASVWRESNAARIAIRGQKNCLADLNDLGVPAIPVTHAFATPVPVPIALTGPVDGVSFVMPNRARPLEIACELAARLPSIARVLKPLGVTEVVVISSYRDHPSTSFHTFGLALDVAAFTVKGRKIVIARDFEVTPDSRTCEATPSTANGKSLLAIACALARSDLLNTIITPNYNQGHHDHFHLDLRPDDPRIFLR